MAGTTVGGNPTWGEACRPNRKEDCGNNKMKKQKLFLRKKTGVLADSYAQRTGRCIVN
jgi:hypothetical protein